MADQPLLIFGEVLYDCFPDGRKVLGGAPFNVAWHLKGLGYSPRFISRVGADQEGRLILDSMRRWGMDITGMQVDDGLPTGEVFVTIEEGEPSYEICHPRAWDNIEAIEPGNGGMLYHGSLALRSEKSRESFLALRSGFAGPIFMDLNLRPPDIDWDLIHQLLPGLAWLKINLLELRALLEDPSLSFAAPEAALERVVEDFGVQNIVLTAGVEGALLYGKTGMVRKRPAPRTVQFADAVGAGDAFSAMTIDGLQKGFPLDEVLARASQFAAKVCGIAGATSSELSLYTHEGVSDW